MRAKFGRTLMGVGAFALLAGPAQAVPITFSNPAPITIPGSGAATPFPSTINVSGVTGATSLTVTLTGLSHTFPNDIDILLVGPNGASVVLMSDAGGANDIVNITLTFQDGAPLLPDDGQIVSGTFGPSNFEGVVDPFTGSGIVPPYGTTLAGLLAGNPNGLYRLFVVDDLAIDSGGIAGGFSLTFEVPAVAAVPEPASMTLLGLGAAGLAAARLRRRKLAA